MLDQDYFNNLLGIYKFPWNIYHSPIKKEIIKECELLSQDYKVLDIGCGAGLLDNFLHKEVYGVDINKKAIEFCQKHYHRGKERYKLIGIDQKYPFKDEFFDIILCLEVIEHVMNIPFFLGEIKRVLKSEGIILLSTPNYSSLLLKILESTILEWVALKRGFTRKTLHPNKYTKKRLKDTLEEYFNVLKIKNMSLGMVLFVKAKKF